MPAQPTTRPTPSPPSPGRPRSPTSPASTTPCISAGPATSVSARPSRPSPTTADTTAPGPPRSTPTPAPAATTTRTRCASSPAPGSASSTDAGRTTSPTTPPDTATPDGSNRSSVRREVDTEGVTRDPVALTTWSFVAAAVFWAIADPWSRFDAAVLAERVPVSLGSVELPLWVLVAWIVVLGAVVPFWLSIAGLRHLAPTAAGLVATVEPGFASIVAWLWVEQQLTGWQVAGGAGVLSGVVLAQTAPALPAPSPPPGAPAPPPSQPPPPPPPPPR